MKYIWRLKSSFVQKNQDWRFSGLYNLLAIKPPTYSSLIRNFMNRTIKHHKLSHWTLLWLRLEFNVLLNLPVNDFQQISFIKDWNIKNKIFTFGSDFITSLVWENNSFIRQGQFQSYCRPLRESKILTKTIIRLFCRLYSSTHFNGSGSRL